MTASHRTGSTPAGTEPGAALAALAAELRAEGPVVSPHVAEAEVDPVLGELVAAGGRCAASPGGYAAVIESVREGYLLHYGQPRLLAALEPDLRLLIGDHLYARGIERLIVLGDLLAIRELADLISIAAQLDSDPGDSLVAGEVAWLAICVAIAVGPGDGHDAGKRTLRESGDPEPLWRTTLEVAEARGLSSPLARAREAVGFPPSDRG